MANCILSFANLRTSMFAAAIIVVAPLFADEQPWDSEPFTGDAHQILAAVKQFSAPEHADVEVFLDETTIRYDDKGRRTVQTRNVYRILTEAGIDSHGTVSAAWTPWNENRPTIQARVINHDGHEKRLIDREIADVPAEQDGNIYSDERRLQAPLPAIQAGSFVETLTLVAESEPMISCGRSEFLLFNRLVETHKVVWNIELPAETPFKFQEFGPGLTSTDKTIDGRRHLSWTSTERLGLAGLETDVPVDVIQGTQVVYSTAKSWEDVAQRYGDLVETTLNDHDLAVEAGEILAGEMDREQKLEKLTSYVKQQIRYTGLMFGNGTIVPTSPTETLRRRYGDCKDKSVLLIGLLKAAGIESYPVLIRSSFGRDIRPDMPGFGMFNHMIVYVPGENELYIDPTASMVPLRQLPAADQGRFCLIVKPSTKHLSRTPEAVATENGLRRVRDVFVDELNNSAMIHETTMYVGAAGADLRDYAVSSGDREFRTSLKKSAEERLASKEVSEVRWTSLRDTATPFEVSLQAQKSMLTECTVRQGRVTLNPSVIVKILNEELFDFRPYMTAAESSAVERNPNSEASQRLLKEKQMRRKQLLGNLQPAASEFVCRIHWPVGFQCQSLPAAIRIQIADGYLDVHYEVQPDGVLAATFKSSTGSNALDASEIELWQHELRKLFPSGNPDEWSVTLTADHASYRDFESGNVRAGFKAQRDEFTLHPESIPARIRLTESYVDHGFIEVARELAMETVTLAPESSTAHHSAGFAYIVPSFCAPTSKEDLQKALDFCRKSVELDPSNETARMTLLNLLRIYVNIGAADREMKREAAELVLPVSAGMNEKAQLFIAQCLFLGEDYEKLMTFLDQIPDNRFAAGFKVAAVSVQHGSQEGFAVLNTLPQADRELALAIALDHLSTGRHYKLLLEFMDNSASQTGKSRPEFVEAIDTVKTLRRYEKVVLSDASVYAVLQQVYVNAAAGRDLRGRSDNLIHAAKERKRTIEGSIRTSLIAIDALKEGSLLVPERVADSVSLLKYAIEGSDTNGYRVGLVLNERKLNIYLASIDGELKVIATDDCPGFLGAEALRLLDSDNVPAARQFVQWGFEVLSSSTTTPNRVGRSGLDPVQTEPLIMLWSSADAKTANLNKTRLAAIALADPESISDPMPFLTSIRKTSRPAEQLQIDRLMLYWCEVHKQTTEGLRILERMGQYPQAREYYLSNKPLMLFNDKQYSEARSFVMMLSRQNFAPASVNQFMASIALAQGRSDEAVTMYRRIADRADATSYDFNRAAWASLFLKELDERALIDAIKATDNQTSPAGLFTLAVVLAETGKTKDAMLQVKESKNLSGRPKTNTEHFYVPGRVAEQLGMMDVAEKYYQLAATSENADRPDNAAFLAVRRLQVIRESSPSNPSDSTLPFREVSNSDLNLKLR